MVLILTGIASASHYFILSDTDSKRNMAISGGLQFGLGLVLGLSSSNKTYEFNDENGGWRVQ